MLSLAFLLILIMDPFGNLIVVNSLLSNLPLRQKQVTVLREGVIAVAILLSASLFGSRLLAALGLDQFSLQLAGGIVLFLIALGMLFPSRRMLEDILVDSPLIVPIAMPLIAGPSAISMVIVFSQKHPLQLVTGAVLLATTATTVLLALASHVFSFLGQRGAMAIERLMGMFLVLISVQMMLDGIASFVESLANYQ